MQSAGIAQGEQGDRDAKMGRFDSCFRHHIPPEPITRSGGELKGGKMRKKKQQELKKLDITEDELKAIKSYERFQTITEMLTIIVLMAVSLIVVTLIAGGLWQ